MKVLLVSNGYPPASIGGVETYTSGVAQALHARGHQVTVVCPWSKPGEPEYQLAHEDRDGIALYRLINNFTGINTFDGTFADARVDDVFDRLLGQLQPDLIHFNHLIQLSARLPLVAQSHGIPSLFTAHDFWALCQRIYLHNQRKQPCPGPVYGGDCFTCISSPAASKRARTAAISALRHVMPFALRVRLRKLMARDDYFLPELPATPQLLDERYRLFREALDATRLILVPSHFVKQMFVDNGYRAEHIEVLPLGITKPQPGPVRSLRTDGNLRLAYVGAILPWKGTEVLVRAFMAAENSRLRLTLYGREDIVPAFARSLRQLAAADPRIGFAGPFQPSEKDDIYHDIDVLVSPSTAHESFSLVAREALRRGVPVIASDLGALPEVVKDGVNGFLVAPGDVDALAGLFARLADHPEVLSGLQVPGPVEILSVEQHVERLLGIYDTCRARPS